MKNTHTRKTVTKTPFALRLLRFIYNTAGRIFPVYFGNKAYELWFTTTRFKTPAYEQSALNSAHQEVLLVNNLPNSVMQVVIRKAFATLWSKYQGCHKHNK